jgi:hypothetical protein
METISINNSTAKKTKVANPFKTAFRNFTKKSEQIEANDILQIGIVLSPSVMFFISDVNKIFAFILVTDMAWLYSAIYKDQNLKSTLKSEKRK